MVRRTLSNSDSGVVGTLWSGGGVISLVPELHPLEFRPMSTCSKITPRDLNSHNHRFQVSTLSENSQPLCWVW